MQGIEVVEEVNAPAGRVWALWEDVEGSPRWDGDVRWSRLGGAFEAGTAGAFELAAGPRIEFVLTEVVPGVAYENLAYFAPGVRVRFTHELEPLGEARCRVRHGASFEGPLGAAARLILGAQLRTALAKALQSLARLAETERAPVDTFPTGSA